MKHRMNPKTVCPSPATQTAASLPAPIAGQGVGFLQRGFRFLRAASRPGARRASRSALRSAFSALLFLMKSTVHIAPMAIAMDAAANTSLTINSTSEPLWMLTVWMTVCCLLALAIFHWVCQPLIGWFSRWFIDRCEARECGE